MAGDNNQNNQNKDLNDAVEQTETNDAGTPSQQQNQQNQQNTIASTVATGAENTDAADEANQAMEDNPSGAGTEEEASASGGAVQEDAPESSGGSDAAQSNVVDSVASDGGSGEEASGSGGAASGAGAQAVGGGDASGSEGGSDAEGNDAQGQAVQTSAAPSASSSDSEGSQGGDNLDSETTEETFAVDVQDTSEETTTQVEDDFDSETTSETFQIKVEGENDAPEVEQDLAYIMDEDGTITFTQEQLLEYASDVDGDDLVASNVQVGANASVQDNGDGTFTVVPDADFNGELDLTFDISDGQETVSSSIDLTVRPINDAPVPEDKTFEVEEDGTLIFTDADLLAGATDIEGDNLTVEGVSYDGGDGILTDNGNGTYTFAPNENFNGDVNFSFDVSDGTDTVSANIDVSVTPVDDAPVSGNLAYSVDEDGSIRLSQEQLLSQASDVEGDALTASNLSVDGNATVTQNDDGSFTITPDADFNGDIDISFDISDGTNTVQATADLTVNPINDLPVPQDQQFSVEEDGTLIFTDADLLTGATDIEGDNLTVEGVSYDGGDGILTDNGNGTYTFAPNENFNGDVNFSFDVSDGTDTVSANIDVSVTPVDDAPVSGNLAYSVDEDGSIRLSQEQLLSQASDVEGDALTASNLSVDGNATVTQNDDGSFTITPDADFNGDIDISFDISDGTNTVQATADLTVNPINDLPVPQDQQFSVEEDGTLQFTDADLLAGATDIEGDDLSVTRISYEGTDGVLTDNGDGTYSFAPNENFNGDVNFSFDVSDGTDTVSANVDVSVTPVNDPPVAGSTSYTVHEDNSITISDAQLLANSSDLEGDVSIDSVSYSGSDGVLQINGDGTYTFSPNENFNGEVTLDVVVADEEGATDVTTAGITVLEVNDPPVAGPTSYTIDEDSVLTFSESQVLLNASDVEGDVELVGISYDGPDGIFTVNDDGTCSFAPNENFNGQVQLDVTIRDEDGAEVDTVINVNVLPINDAPVSGDLAYSVDEDGAITLSQEQLLSQASDIEGDGLTASDLTVDGNATVTANDDGSFTITPDADFNGDIDIQFNITDGTDTIQATADLTVNPVNDLPVPQDQQFSVEEDGTLQFTDADLLAGATDIDGDNLTVDGISYTGSDGVLTDHGDGTYTFAPNENFNGDVSFSFGVSDGTETVPANVDVSVTPVNDPPVAGSTSYTVDEDNAITISDEQLLANSSDVEGAVSIDSVTYSGTDGVFQDNGDGTYTFMPNENFSGDISLDVIVADEQGAIDETTAGITVIEVNDPPVAGPTSYTVDEDSVLTFSESQILANASDIEGDVELVGISYEGSDGIFTINGDGTCSFAPNENFNGQVQLDVTIQDEKGATVDTHINVDVLPINDPPVSGDLAYTINEDSSITLSQEQLLAKAGDIDSENLEAINLSTDDNATIQYNDDGSYTITPDENYNGDLDLTFDIIDNDGGSVQVGLDITVNPVNDLPQAQDQQFTVEEDGTLLFTDADLLEGASDIDGDDLSIENVLYTGADGVLTDNGDGTYSFAPNENFNGDVQFTFDVSDGTGSTPAFIDVSVTPVNDPPVAGSTSYTVQEDGQITISDEQLLANSSDVEGDVALANVSYSGNDGSFVDNGDGTYTFTPNENFDGNISLDVTVIDQDGATDTTTAGIDVIAVNDAPETSGIQAEVDEDNAITITQEQLLANATDIEGDDLVASNLQTNDPDATIVANDDGSFTITHTENFNGELDFTYNISDGENDVLTTLDLTVNPVNDAPEAGDEIFIQAEEDQTVGVSLREEPALRLDQAPENGIIEANLNEEWVQLEVGQEVPADTEVRFIPNDDALANGTHTSQIGTFDDNASLDDWGTAVDPYTREFVDGDLKVTVQSNDDPLGAWNGKTHIGHGIGDTDRQGLSGDEKLTVSVEGQDINEISFHLDGLGGWFMEESRHFTEVEIRAFNSDGDLIDSMTYHKEDRGSYETDYTLTVNEPVSYFELGTIQGNGTYVVQNMTVSQTCHDEAVFTSIGVDGTEITETVELNIREGDSEIELTADLPNVTIDTEGSTQFASVVITEEQLLAQASDIDSDVLDIQNLELVGDNAEHATLTDNGDGTWTVTPDENFYGEIELGYQVTDGELTDDNIININFEAVNDAPIVSGPIVLSTDEDVGITFSADDLLANASDVEGDALSISDISYSGDNGELVDNGDGTYTFMPNENFNGEVDIDYKVFDGTDEVDTHLDLAVIPVNDVPVPGAPLHTQMLENGTIIIEAKDLLSGATDVDGDILHIENLLLVDQSQGTLTDNGDNTFTFEPTSNFYGEVNLTFDISDGQASAPSTAKIDVEIVNEGPEVSGPVDAVVDEDGSITITQEDLLANATDVDGDNLEAVNLSTNDPNATIVENADGSFTITPSENFFGEIEFTYDVTDAIETVAADLNLTVNPVNDLPDVPDLSFTTEDGEAITITEAELLAQATDIEGDDLSVVNVTSLSDTVQVTDNGDGTYTLTPEQGFFGNVDLTFDVSDGTDVVAANIDLKVEFVNDAPEAAPIVADVDEDGSILVTQEMLLENASDQDGDDLYATALETNDPNATIVDNGDGTYTVTPSENFNGEIAFTYEVNDGELSTSTDMTLTVNPVNDIPIVAPAMYSIEEDGSILFTEADLLSGAVDVEGDDLSVTSINYSGDEGTVTDNGDGTFSFVPEEHFSGDLQFSFTVSDGTDEVEQDINVHIEAVADAPDLVIRDGDGAIVDDEAIIVDPGGVVELNIAAALVDQDLSETLTVTVDGVPEGSVISYDNEGVLNDQDNGITSFNDTEITVTFEGETAGYQNTAGYYKVDEDGNITGVEVVYENASQVGGGGDLIPGQDQFSFQISEGESFNLFLIPNGHNFNDFASMQDGQYEFRAADGSPANMDTVDPQLVFVGADGSETVIQSQFGDAVFHGGSSSELNQDGIEHTRTTVNEDGELVYGFEDLYGGGDADYTDFNFTIDVGEVNSQIYSGEVTVGPDGSVAIPTTAIDKEIEIQLPEDFSEQLEVHVTATATEVSNDDSETVSQTIYINATGATIEHAPEALPVSAQVEEDGSILITQDDLLANASDLDGDQLTALNLATDDENITITDNGDGTYTLTPDADFNGDITFTFDVSDGDDVVSTNLELLVSPVNDAPEPQDQAFTVGEDGVLTFTDADLLTGATDIEGDDLSVEGVTYTGADGVLTDNGDGTYSFAPNENFNGDVNFTFDVSDGTDTVTANIDVTVTPENDPPVAGSTAYTVHEDNSVTISDEQLIANSSDIEGDVLIDSVSYSGNDGVLEINGDGTYTFSPNENFSGEVSLDVVVVDEDGATDSTTAGITVIEVNDPPIAGPTAYTIDEDQVLTFSESQVLLNASDVEGDVELVGISYDGPDGIFSVNGDGTCSFAPNENFNGQVQLDVTIRDEDGAEVDTYITVDVLPINDAPVSGNLAYSVDEDNSITLSQEQLLAQATDVEGDALSATNLVVDGDATVTANDDGSFTITPDANFNGDIDITFDINDGSDTIVATADLTVNPVNDLPQPEDQAFTIGEDGVLLFTDEDLLDGATDIDGDDLSVESVSYTGADGVLTDNGDGTYSFAPNENFNGDVNFTFDVSDGTDTVTANIDVGVTPENDPPVAGSTSYTVHEDNSITISNEQLLANSSDVEGEVAIDSVSYSGADGVFQDNGDGTYTFSPNENFNGEVSLDVVVVDEDGATDSTTAGITVLEVNDPPIAGATSYSVNEDEVITISSEQLLANASDVEGEVAIDSVSYSGSDGIFTDNGDGTFSFAPNENFNGDVSLDVVVTDEDGATVATNANIDVLPVNDAPVSGDLAYSVDEDGSITLSQEQLLAQASDVDGDDLTAFNLTVDGNATVVANDDGSFTITPDADFNGDIDLSFDITDGDATIQATADLTVNPVNDLPTVGQPQFVTQEDTSFTFTEEQLLQNAGDIDGDNLTVENVASDSGTLVDNGDGTYTFAPNENFDGNVNVTFDVNDGTATVPAEANIDVQSVVDMPELSIASDLVIASDNFESGSNGWNANTESSQGFETGDMLGRIGGTGGDEAVSKTYDIPSDVNEVNISFSFYEIDSWDGESFQIFVGGEQLTTLENSAFRTQDGTTTLYDSDGNEVGEVIHGASQREGFSGWNDQAHQINLTVPVEDGELQLGFGSTLNQSTWDESFGIDNIEITVADADYQIIGTEDTPVPLDIDAALTDTDGSENLSILIEDVPEGSSLSAGVDNGDGTWSLQPGELEGLEFIPSADFNGDVTLTVNATSTDVDTGTTATATQDVTIHISPTNDAPEVTGDISAVTAEDNSITLTQEQLLEHAVDIDGDDLSAINLSTNDENATVEMNEDGSFTITPSENFYGDIEFTYDVTDGEEVVAAGLDLTVTPVNDAPEPQDQAFTVGEDGLLTFTDADLLTGATDVEGDNLTVEGVTYTGADGVLTDNGDGTYSFAPNENFNGDVNFTFDVSDGTDTTSANIDVSVTPENDPPVAGSTSYTVHEDNSITISDEQLLANSSDIEGDVDISSVTYSGNDGVFQDNGDGTYTFSPNENFTGDVSLDVVVVDEDGAVDTTTAGITVLEVNDPPIAGTTSYTIDEDEVITISAEQLLANSSDIEGEIALDSVSYSGSEGIFTDNGDGTFSFAPNQNFNGEVNLDVVVVDEDGAIASTTANIDVLPINDAPVSGDLAYSVDEDNSITLSQEQLLAQATDVEGDALTASNLVVDGDATVTANDDGSFTITPDANFNGDIDITFDINDGSDTIVATADLTVNPVNDLPQPEDQAFTIGEGGVLTFTDQDLLDGATDIDGDDLSVEGVSYTGADGVLTDNGDGTYSFAPNENFNGDVNFTFDVSDGTDTVTANIDVTVTPENDPPVAGSTSYTVHEDNSITISDEQLLANSSDVEGDVAVDSVSYSGTDGVFQDNGDGTYTFSPNENFNGEVSLDVVVVDEDGATDSTTAGITVLEVNDPPIAGATSYSVNEDEVITISSEQLLANASDVEGEVAIDSVSYSGSDGIFTDNGDGTFSFAPNANFDGDVSLDVVVVDEDGATASTNANIDVLPINDAPVSGNLAYSVDEDNSITLSQEQLLAQASDVEGDALTASNLVVDGDATVTANDDGSFTITPDANFNGDIDITFDINDGSDTIVATADLTVNPVNDLPQPEDQAFTIGEDGVLLFTDEDLLDGATDIDGDSLSVEGVSYTGADGVLTDNGDGTYSFAPNENFNGDVNFTFDVSDGTDTVTANIDVSVTPENDPPVAGSTSYTVHEDNSITISNEQLLANSSDVEGEVAIDSVSYSGADGVFQDNGDGTYTFSPNENFNGEVSLDVVVVDEDGATDSTTAGITVLEVNDPPIAGATSYSVNEDEVITISSEQLLANASDVEGDVAIDSVSYSGSDGIFTDNGDGTFSFAPNENFNGDVSLDVVVVDEDGATASTNASIDVLPINDAPVSGDLAYSMDEDGSITLSQEQLLAQAGDVDGDDLTASNLTVDGNATVVANDDGSFTITPDADFNGDIDLSFDITDGDATIQATADLTVNPVNDLPTVGQPQFVTQEDTSFTFTEEQLLQNAGDIDGDNLTVENVASDSGALVDNGDGTYTFAPNENFDGNVNVTFDVNDGTATVPAEANIDVQSVVDMPELSIASDLVIASDNFESGSNGWNANTESSQGFETGDMLGRIGGTGGDEAVSKTYDIPSDVNEVNISFSFYEIDSWDGESFQIFVGGEQLTTLENSAFRTQDGTTTLYDSDGNEVGEVIHGASQREGFSGWNDQAHQINLTVPVEDGELQLGFGSTLNQSTWDESFGIDNIEITVADADYQIIGTEDTPVPLDIDAALTDTDGSENLAILIEDVPEGSALSAGVDNGDGTWSLQPGELEGLEFIPSADFNGDVTLTVNATSTDVDTGTTATATQDVTIHISPTNDAPEVTGDITAVTAEDNSITLTQEQLLEHAVDIDGDDLSAINLSTNDENATVEMNEDGSFTITPSENFYGDIEFSYDVTDGEEVVAAGLDLTVTPVNDAPEPQDQAFTVGEDGILTFTDADLLTGATDVEGDNLTVEGVTYTGADGVLTDNGDGTYSFAPNENFNGDVNFTFDVSDGTDTTSANIDVSVTPENDPPVAGSTSYTVHEDNSITISDEQLLANSSDIEGDVDISSVTYSGNDGVFQDNGDGTYTFSPNENFNGEVSLDVVVVDEEGATDSTTAGITVLEVNDPPIAGATSYSVNEDEVIIFTEEQLLAQSSDVEGDVSLESVSYSGSDGILTANDDGTYSFAPNENFNGGVSLDVVVADEDGATATTNANIDVLPVNDAPVSGDLAYSVDEDGSITLSQEQLLAQAGDVDSDNLEAVNLTAVANATVVENQDGSFTITPDANFNGDIDLSFDLIDNDGASVEVGVDLTVNPINDAPQSTPVNIAGIEDTTILITQDMLLANATDIDNTYDELSAVDLVIDEQYGDLLDNGDGTWSFSPAENFNGDVPMSFGVSDGDLVTPVEGNLNVEAVNDAPEAPTIQMQGEEDVVMVIDPAYIADQVTDLDGDEISVESITVRAPANATLTQQPDGMYHLVTTQDFNGLVELGYTATDGEEVVEGSLNVDVIPVNDAPFNVGNAFMATDEDGAFTFDAGDLMNLFGDIDTENLVVSRIITAEGEDGGEVTDNGDGTWTFTPTGDFAGVSDLQVVVSDGEFETVLDVPVFVRPVADGAVITTDHDGPLVFGEDETGHLGLNVGLIDDSETLSNLVMTGFPVGFEVTDGVNTITITEPGQYIDLNEWDISDLQMTPPADFNGEFFVTVTATTVDYGDEPEEFEDGIDSGDFETLAGEPVILTADDLIGLAENVDADAGDEVKFVHLADRSQGEIVDNGDGTWTFNPAPGFTGEADIAYVIDKDGVLHDEQTGVVVKEDAPQENASPEIDSISTTEMAADGTLSFTNDDMLSTLSDAEGDSLSIESVSLMEGQGVIETDNQGNYQFTPAEGYTGDVQVGFIATDGENRIESFFNVDIQGEGETTTSEGYALADDGSLTLTEAQLIDELGISPSAEVLDVADANDAGFFAKSGDEEWTYWPNDDFDGNLAMDVQVNDNGEVSTQNLSIQVADDSAQSDEPQIQTAQASSEQQVGEAQQPEEQAANGADSEEESAADVTAAPGDTISISVPDEVSGNESVDYAEMSGLPDGASVSNALDNGDGSFTLSGNLNQPVSVDLPEGYEGTSEIQFQGYDELGSAVEGASGTVEVEVDDQYTMQGSAQDQQPDMAGMESGGSDWTSAGGQEQGVDFTDDSGSFDSDTQTGTDQGNDFDQSSM
ncbi:tandem-95 repeat protein [Vibrio owensii]|uniref:Tandem-95 repeat protein n=3 Tax=Vibrio harveyi group TaxID=717610 RepID=A0AAP9GFH5_9VIBR|nr:tandem-95 repeat protein [Vibrio owensii]AYO16800.1 tandem-95 repeat protein [Vibrio owensii]QGH48965.1 tandem-95 repeat protein [Vibrio owensii]